MPMKIPGSLVRLFNGSDERSRRRPPPVKRRSRMLQNEQNSGSVKPERSGSEPRMRRHEAGEHESQRLDRPSRRRSTANEERETTHRRRPRSESWSNVKEEDSLISNNDRNDKSNKSWHQEVESLRRHNVALTQERVAQESEIMNQNKRLQRAPQQVTSIEHRSSHEGVELGDLKEELERVKQEKEESEANLTRHADDLESKLERHRNDLFEALKCQKNLESIVATLQAEKKSVLDSMDLPSDELRHENINLRNELQARDLKILEQQQEVESLQKIKSRSENTLAELKAAEDSADQEIDCLERKIAEIQASRSELDHQMSNLQHQYEASKASKDIVDQENNDLTNALEAAQHTKGSLEKENSQLANNIAILYREKKAMKSLEDNLKNQLQDTLHSLEAERSVTKREKRDHEKGMRILEDGFKKELQDTRNSLEDEKSVIERQNMALSDEITNLKSVLETARSHSKIVDQQNKNLTSKTKRSKEKISSLEHERGELLNKITALNTHITEQEKSLKSLQVSKTQSEQDIATLCDQVAALNHTVKSERAESQTTADTLRNEMEQQRLRSEAQIQKALQAMGNYHTPRTVIFQKILSQATPTRDIAGIPGSNCFMKACTLQTLTNDCLDIPLEIEQAQKLARSIKGDEIAISGCSVCQLPKLTRTGRAAASLRVDEFIQAVDCCRARICQPCYLEEFTHSFLNDYWLNLARDMWVKCPARNCDEILQIGGKDGLEAMLRNLGDPNLTMNMAAYDHIRAFRNALKRIQIPFENHHLKVSSALYFQLKSMGRMHSITRVPSNAVREREDMPSFDPSEIQIITVEYQGSIVEVAFPLGFTRRKRIPKECSFCIEKIYDIETDFSRVLSWIDDCSDFQGDWMWEVLQLPLKLGAECNHEIDFCTKCLQRHLEVQLEQYGRGRSENLSCPSGGCRRQLEYNEVKLYAKSETFTKYDKYLNLNALSRSPSFRWCLRPGCDNGDLYEDIDPGNPRIMCSECAFEMCYTHSVPWHEGQTCDQYENIKNHGDPDFQQTQHWITQNTKKCPNCGQNTQKGEDCFHMTCTICRHEYCWECLAPWNQISPRPGEYIVSAHREHCEFRRLRVEPTQIYGSSVENALRRRR